MNEIKTLKKIKIADGGVRIHRHYQPAKKDGTPMANRQGRISCEHLVVYPNGDYRYYNRNGLLARERASAERERMEADRGVRRALKASLAALAAGRA